MKQIFCLICLSCISLAAWGQFSVSGVQVVEANQKEIDAVFVVDQCTNGALSFKASENHNFTWYSYTLDAETGTLIKQENGVQNTSVPLIEAASQGYQLKTEGQKDQWVWVFDYSQVPLNLDTLIVNSDVIDRCQNWQLDLAYSSTPLDYDTLGHQQKNFRIDRELKLSYDSTYYDEGAYVVDSVCQTVPLSPNIIVPSPLGNTEFIIEGDQFAIALGQPQRVESEQMQAIAIEMHPTASVRIRENAKNEKDKDTSTPTKLSGSAPLNIEVVNQVSPAGFFYDWCLSTDKDFASCQVASAEKDFRFTFDQLGTYYLRVEVTNSSTSSDPTMNCLSSANYVIEVLESSLDVPNVFSPNGDGINDEFRVAYKSLTSFRGRIYNVWGRLVFEWKDPAKGWDGTIGGVPAAEGTYFCVIEATGADKDENGNFIKYLHRGDINLLR